MTLASGEFLFDGVALLTGTAGAVASSAWGYIPGENPITFGHELNLKDVTVQGEDLTLEQLSRKKGLTVGATGLQFNKTFLAQSLGTAAIGNTVVFGDPSVSAKITKISVALVGQDLDGNTFRLDLPYCNMATESLAFEVGQEETSFLEIEIKALAPDAGGSAYPTYSFNTGNQDATISSGVLTRTAGYIFVSGESAVSDDLDSITGSSLVDGERLTLTLKAANVALSHSG